MMPGRGFNGHPALNGLAGILDSNEVWRRFW
jgi:hypothetical protein